MSNTIKYVPAKDQRKQNTFVEEYFSGTDCTIYIDGIIADNIGDISFTVQEQLKPLYGYASRLFDDISVGNRIVVGTIRIPVENPEPVYTDYKAGKLDLTIESVDDSVTTKTTEIDDPKYPTRLNKNIPSWALDNNISNNTDTQDYIPNNNPDYNAITNEIVVEDNNPVIDTTEVLTAQHLLSLDGYDVNRTGVYDKDTVYAVIDYQKNNNLPITGALDKDTMDSLLNFDISTITKDMVVYNIAAVRMGPADTYSTITYVEPNSIVKQIDIVGDYIRVIVSEDVTGYVHIGDIIHWVIYDGGVVID